MTARRPLGTGPDDLTHIRAAQADLLQRLPRIRLPDLDDLRARGVLSSHPHAAEGNGQVDEGRRYLASPS
ncbi:hypothetical protein [Streptomyces naphthomycinicus]|uniref:hypothetical protein n=1 Tax=Streptomyces naphthomycinicus TaxID=2872625 RepID=UPI001CECFE44|nr:hypothetical protein [Streptomyces sp. TML10]